MDVSSLLIIMECVPRKRPLGLETQKQKTLTVSRKGFSIISKPVILKPQTVQ